MVQTSLNLSISTKKWKYQQGRGNTLCQEHIRSLSNLSSAVIFINPLVFRKFRAVPIEMVGTSNQTETPQISGTPSASESTNNVSLIPFCQELAF